MELCSEETPGTSKKAFKWQGTKSMFEKLQHEYEQQHSTLVGSGRDGAVVSVGGQCGLKGQLQHALPWLYLVLLLCTSSGACLQGCLSSSVLQRRRDAAPPKLPV